MNLVGRLSAAPPKRLSSGASASARLFVAASFALLALSATGRVLAAAEKETPAQSPPAATSAAKEAAPENKDDERSVADELGSDQPGAGVRGMDELHRPRDRPPRLIHIVPPEYPAELSGSGITAEVMVSMMVDRMGKVRHVRVEESPDEVFTDAALNALEQWDFLPAIKSGKTTNGPMRISVLVAEEFGDRMYYDFAGGRIALEDAHYRGEYEHPVRRLLGLRPVYPFDLLAEDKPGEVLVEFTIDDDSGPKDVKVLESTHKEFSLAAEAAVFQWQYSPAMLRGQTVAVRLRYRISFQPDEIDEGVRRMARNLRTGHNEGLTASQDLLEIPKVLRALQPRYPRELVRGNSRGRVNVIVVVTSAGEVRLPRIENAFDEVAGYIAATMINYWRFQPALDRNKTPVAVSLKVPFAF